MAARLRAPTDASKLSVMLVRKTNMEHLSMLGRTLVKQYQPTGVERPALTQLKVSAATVRLE